jgi:hypothetical protein
MTTGDPAVIRRFYKPTASEGETRFNDNRRTHVFLADATGAELRASSRTGHV